jgi:hypothetical protein
MDRKRTLSNETVTRVLNPNLRNINTQLIVLDSRYRQTILPYNSSNADSISSSTNYTINLSDNLTNVTSLKLQSVQIPNTWYRFSLNQGNTCFQVIDASVECTFILAEGNYTPSELAVELNTISNWDIVPDGWTANYNTNSHKMEFTNTNDISFYGSDCSDTCINVSYNNQSLLWCLGLRDDFEEIITIFEGGSNKFVAVVDTFGPNYLSIILDDYNQNKQNQGVVNISITDTVLSVPSYYNYDLIFDCSNITIPSRPLVDASASLTINQIYSTNQILASRKKTKTRNNGVTSSDIFAIIPIQSKTSNYESDQPLTYIPYDTSLHERKYFGPVDITRMRLRLVDDKGNTLNLNGGDWTVTMIAESLYQY